MAGAGEEKRPTMSTYLIAYEEALAAKIEAGGSAEEIDKAVRAYNHFHRSEFDTWLTGATLRCTQCEKDASKTNVQPLDEIACEDHRTSR